MFIKKNCFFCFVFIFGLTISVFSQAEATTTNRQLKYGDMVHILNRYGNWGGYLDTRGTGCQGNYLCVSTSTSNNRDNGSGTWKIISANGKKDGEYVLVSDNIYLLNQYPYTTGNGGYLDVCSTGCQGNYLCVSTSTSNNRDNGSGTWKIISASGKKDGEYVLDCDNIYLLNQYPYTTGNGGYLDTCCRGCQGNYLCVSTATSHNRDNGSGTWEIILD